jgi:hypothetical protein
MSSSEETRKINRSVKTNSMRTTRRRRNYTLTVCMAEEEKTVQFKQLRYYEGQKQRST